MLIKCSQLLLVGIELLRGRNMLRSLKINHKKQNLSQQWPSSAETHVLQVGSTDRHELTELPDIITHREVFQ